MSDSWFSPKLLEKIANNVPFLQRALLALVKQDPSSIADVPKGGKRLVEISQGKWQLQQFNGTSWEPLGKLQMDVDTVDSFNAALTPQPNVIPVRDENGDLPGNITGHAATADSAETLSQTLVVEKGGTGATTPEQGRRNLGVPPTSHASSSSAYGLGSNLNYGHMRGDGITANGVNGEIVVKNVAVNGVQEDTAAGRGQIGRAFNVPESGVDFHSLIKSGCYWFTNTAIKNSTNKPPTNIGGFCVVLGAEMAPYYYTKHIYYQFNVSDFFIEEKIDEKSWSEWIKNIDSTSIATASIPGIVTSGDGTKIGINGELGVDETVVRTNDNQTINGAKSFTNIVYCKSPVPGFYCVETDYDRLVIPDEDKNSFDIITFDKNNIRTFGTYSEIKASGISSYGILVYQPGITNNNFSIVSACIDKNGKKWGEAPTPEDGSDTNHIATTEWVRQRILESQDLINNEISMIPDWGKKSNRALNTAYTASENGYLYVYYNCSPGENTIGLEYTPIGGSVINYNIGRSYGSSSSNGTTIIPVEKGDTYKIVASGSVQSTPVFIPAKK